MNCGLKLRMSKIVKSGNKNKESNHFRFTL